MHLRLFPLIPIRPPAPAFCPQRSQNPRRRQPQPPRDSATLHRAYNACKAPPRVASDSNPDSTTYSPYLKQFTDLQREFVDRSYTPAIPLGVTNRKPPNFAEHSHLLIRVYCSWPEFPPPNKFLPARALPQLPTLEPSLPSASRPCRKFRQIQKPRPPARHHIIYLRSFYN